MTALTDTTENTVDLKNEILNDAYWKEKRAPLSRASIEQFRKELKNGQGRGD